MARSAPLNYVAATALAIFLWVVTGIFVGNYLAEEVALRAFTVERFLFLYRVVSAAIAGVGLLSCYYWFYYGGREETAADLDRARRVWFGLVVGMFGFAAGGMGTMVVIFRTETFLLMQYAIFFLVMSVHTYIVFWICTLLFSPRTVEFVPVGK
jgi:hypothetical protein